MDTSSEPTSMKYAAPTVMCACCNDYGKEGNLVWKDKAIPKVEGNKVLIQVKVAAINPVDWKRAKGAGTCVSPPPLNDLVGVIVAKGPSATTPLKVGDHVMTCLYPSGGALSEYVLAAESAVGPIPKGFTPNQAVAMPMGLITASGILQACCHLGPGKKLVILGASGGVGQMVLAMAKTKGVTDILAVASKGKHEMCKNLGGPGTRCCDYRTEDWTKMTQGRPDAVVDCTSNSPCWSFHKSLCVRPKQFVTPNPLDANFRLVNGPLIVFEALWCIYAETIALLCCCGLCGPCYCCTPWAGCMTNFPETSQAFYEMAETGEFPANPFQIQEFPPEQVHMAYDLAQTKPGSKPVIDMTKINDRE